MGSEPYASQRPRIYSPKVTLRESLLWKLGYHQHMRRNEEPVSFFLKLTDGFHIPTLTPGFHLELDFAVGQCCFVFSVLTCSVILKSTMNAQYYAEKSVQIVNWGFHHKTPPTLGRNV